MIVGLFPSVESRSPWCHTNNRIVSCFKRHESVLGLWRNPSMRCAYILSKINHSLDPPLEYHHSHTNACLVRESQNMLSFMPFAHFVSCVSRRSIDYFSRDQTQHLQHDVLAPESFLARIRHIPHHWDHTTRLPNEIAQAEKDQDNTYIGGPQK